MLFLGVKTLRAQCCTKPRCLNLEEKPQSLEVCLVRASDVVRCLFYAHGIPRQLELKCVMLEFFSASSQHDAICIACAPGLMAG